jgi:hypothetical protein
VSEPVYDLPLVPARGDGYLTTSDLDGLLCRLPAGSRVHVAISECEGYEPGLPGYLARWLVGCHVDPHFAPSAWEIAAAWTAEYDRAAADYIGLEARRLSG